MSFDYWSTRRMQYFLEKLKAKIPTVNDGQLQISRNGTLLGSFTANQSSSESINIKTEELVWTYTNTTEWVSPKCRKTHMLMVPKNKLDNKIITLVLNSVATVKILSVEVLDAGETYYQINVVVFNESETSSARAGFKFYAKPE